MTRVFENYFWKNGVPYGVQVAETNAPCTYKIVADPYFKRFSIEAYQHGHFLKIIYDSSFLDFRTLKPEHQTAWERVTINESAHHTECYIRNHEDRIVIKEVCRYRDNYCIECQLFSAIDYHLATQYMYYQALNDPFNGVELMDANDHLVMAKEYEVDELNQFTNLLTENWNFQPNAQNPVSLAQRGSRSTFRQ